MTKRHSPAEPVLNRRGSTVVRFVGYSTGTGPHIASSTIWSSPPAKNQNRNIRPICTTPICHSCIPFTENTSGVQKKASAAAYNTNQWD